MAMTRSMSRVAAAPWSDLTDHVLFLVMMKLGLGDYFAFVQVCRSWKSVALSNKKVYMASRPPMSVCVSSRPRSRKKECYLEDFEGRKLKTILPHSVSRDIAWDKDCIGLSCGYLILFGRRTCDFWLVNPVTRKEHHFPAFPYYVCPDPTKNKFLLVSSPSLGWVFVMALRLCNELWFSVAGSRTWTSVTSTSTILDLHFFNGKIYALTTGSCLCEELKLYPQPKLTVLGTKNNPKPVPFDRGIVSSDENLYVMDRVPEDGFMVQELDFGEMNWVSPDKTIEKYALFFSDLNHGAAAIKQELWAKSWSRYGRHAYLRYNDKSGTCRLFTANMWYFPHDCLNENLIDE